jgi:hypothetical protein
MNDQIEKYKKDIEDRKKQGEIQLKELWNNLPQFNKPEDIPDIPIVEKEEYEEFYIPRLWKAGAIPENDLIDQQIYIGKHRRCTVARWNKEINKFEYWRYKFGTWFIDTCNHFENDDGYALFVPIKLGEKEDFKVK